MASSDDEPWPTLRRHCYQTYEWGADLTHFGHTRIHTNGQARKRVLIVPPDFTRFHSKAGVLTQAAYAHYKEAVTDIMPALGTHAPITDAQREKMYSYLERVITVTF